MKIFASLLFCLSIVCSISAQTNNWSLSPWQTTSIYHISEAQNVLAVKIDSVITDSSSDHFLAWRSQIKFPYSICDSQLLSGQYGLNINIQLPYYSYRVDSAYKLELSISSKEVFNLPFPDSLGVFPSYSSHIYSRLDSLTTQTIFGELDSVAHYSLLNTNLQHFNNEIVLSKNHGLIKIPDLRQMIYAQFDTNLTYRTFELIGQESTDTVIGIRLPDEEYFYSPEAGDKFVYKEVFVSAYWNWQTSCKGFTIVEYFEENGILSFNTSHYDENFAALTSPCIFQSPRPNPLTFDSDIIYGRGNTFPSLWGHWSYLAPSLKYQNEQFSITTFQSSGYCDTFGISWQIDGNITEEEIIKDFGLISYINTGYPGPSTETAVTLQAAFTSKGNYGSWPNGLGIKSVSEQRITAFPNPSENGIFQLSSDKISNLIITDIMGKTYNLPAKKEVDMCLFPSGIYFLNVLVDDNTYSIKLIKK